MARNVTGEEAELIINLSYNIRYAIMDKGTSAPAVARKAGISPSTIRCYIHGKAVPDYEIIKKIAAALDCEVNDLTKTYDHSMPGDNEQTT